MHFSTSARNYFNNLSFQKQILYANFDLILRNLNRINCEVLCLVFRENCVSLTYCNCSKIVDFDKPTNATYFSRRYYWKTVITWSDFCSLFEHSLEVVEWSARLARKRALRV